MFGYYDPESLIVGKRRAAIDFIPADLSEGQGIITRVLKDRAAVDEVLTALGDQKRLGIAAQAAPLREFRGTIALSENRADEAVMHLDGDDSGQLMPAKFAFTPGADDLPEQGYAIGQGAIKDGVLHIYRIAVRPLANEPDAAAAPV